jgi:hypothetical protein
MLRYRGKEDDIWGCREYFLNSIKFTPQWMYFRDTLEIILGIKRLKFKIKKKASSTLKKENFYANCIHLE